MSVIVRDESNDIKLFTKGADSVIFERLSQHQPFAEETRHHLHVRFFCLNINWLFCCLYL